MVGGRARSRAPREVADDPDSWPEANLAGESGEVIAANTVQHIARALAAALAEQRLSLRAISAASGVNRQAIADLVAGRSWPDVATVARLEHATGRRLWPGERGR